MAHEIINTCDSLYTSCRIQIFCVYYDDMTYYVIGCSLYPHVGGIEIFCLRIIIAIKCPCDNCNYCHVWYRNKICCKVGDIHLNLVHYYGPCSIQMRRSHTTTAQVAVRTSVCQGACPVSFL